MTGALVIMILFLVALASAIYVFQHIRTKSDGGQASGQDAASLEYTELVKQREDLVGEQQFSDALKMVEAFTKKHSGSKWIEYANNERELIRKSAMSRFKEIKEKVEHLKTLDKNDDAVELLDHVILHFGIPEIIREAETIRAELIKDE